MKIKLCRSDWLGFLTFCYLNGEAIYCWHLLGKPDGQAFIYWVMIGSFDLLASCGLVFTCLYRNLLEQTSADLNKVLDSGESFLKTVRLRDDSQHGVPEGGASWFLDDAGIGPSPSYEHSGWHGPSTLTLMHRWLWIRH